MTINTVLNNQVQINLDLSENEYTSIMWNKNDEIYLIKDDEDTSYLDSDEFISKSIDELQTIWDETDSIPRAVIDGETGNVIIELTKKDLNIDVRFEV